MFNPSGIIYYLYYYILYKCIIYNYIFFQWPEYFKGFFVSYIFLPILFIWKLQ